MKNIYKKEHYPNVIIQIEHADHFSYLSPAWTHVHGIQHLGDRQEDQEFKATLSNIEPPSNVPHVQNLLAKEDRNPYPNPGTVTDSVMAPSQTEKELRVPVSTHLLPSQHSVCVSPNLSDRNRASRDF